VFPRPVFATRYAIVFAALSVAYGALHAATRADEYYRHVAVKGDTLSAVSARLTGVRSLWKVIQRINNIRDPNVLTPGQTIEIPWSLMMLKAEEGIVTEVSGEATWGISKARCGELSLRIGQRIGEGACIETGAAAYVLLEMLDGSMLRLFGDSRVSVMQMKRGDQAVRSVEFFVEKGRVAAEVNKAQGPFRIRTPQGMASVRGTDFGVVVDPGSAGISVSEGTVEVQSATPSIKSAGEGTIVAPGFGAALREEGGVGTVTRVALLPEPRALGSEYAYKTFGRPILRLEEVSGAQSYVHQIEYAQSGNVFRTVRTGQSQQAEVPLHDLKAGNYRIKTNAVDVYGLLGRASLTRVELSSVPDAPVLLSPPDEARFDTLAVEMRCAQVEGATAYRFQLALDAQFQSLAAGGSATQCQWTAPALTPGRSYFWRVRAVRMEADEPEFQSPLSSVGTFIVAHRLARPSTSVTSEGRLQVRWEGREAGAYVIEIASSPDFRELVFKRRTSDRHVTVPDLPGGTYYVRVNAVDARGAKLGEASPPQTFLVRSLWRSSSGAAVSTGSGALLAHPATPN
jgi:hypothetical protein